MFYAIVANIQSHAMPKIFLTSDTFGQGKNSFMAAPHDQTNLHDQIYLLFEYNTPGKNKRLSE